jgi:tetratricopeptide (TPR) repeat protein
LPTACLSLLLLASGCVALQVGQDVQAARNALQTGRPGDAVTFLTRAAAQDPDYVLPYRLHVSVLSYLGRALYETDKDGEARASLEKALLTDKDDNLAHLYLGLTLFISPASIGTLRVTSAAILSERWRLNRILPNWSGSLNALGA